VGCSTSETRGDAGLPGHDADVLPATLLELQTEPSITLLFGETRQFRVLYTEADGTPIPHATLSLAFVGRAHDSSLASLDIVTADDGTATGAVLGGRVAAAFSIRVAADRAASLHINVSVSDAGFGGLDVRTRYSGVRPVTGRVVAVFAATSCTDPLVATGMGDRTVTLAEGDEEARFFALPAGLEYAVLARGVGPTGETLAQACIDGILIEADRDAVVPVTLQDLPILVDGTYAAELRFVTTAPSATLTSTLGAAGSAPVALAGSDANMLLDALATHLRSSGEIAGADALATARETGDLERSLQANLDGMAVGPTAASAQLADLVGSRAELMEIAGSLTIEFGTATVDWSTAGLSTRSGDPDASRLVIDLPSLGGTPMVTIDALLDLDRARMDVSELVAPIPLGSLGRGVLTALTLERGLDGTAALMLDSGGCGVLGTWGGDQPVIASVCDSDCLLVACKVALETIAEAMLAALIDLDVERSQIVVAGEVTLVDEIGDLRVDSLQAEGLTGFWRAAAGTSGDTVTARLGAVRAVE